MLESIGVGAIGRVGVFDWHLCERKRMRTLLVVAVVACMLQVSWAIPQRRMGYCRERMDWAHLGPRPVSESLSADVGVKHASRTATKANLPSKYDLRDEGLVSSVKSQGAYSCCWAFAACGSLESALLRKLGPNCEFDFSERNIALWSGAEYEPEWDYNGFGLIDQGNNPAMVDAYFMRWAGPVLENDDPYPTETAPGLQFKQDAYGDFFRRTVARYFGGANVTLSFLSSLELGDWAIIDALAAEAGYGDKFRTNFVHTARVLNAAGKKVSVPNLNRDLIPESAFANCPDRQGPFPVRFHVQGSWRLPPRADSLDNETYKYALYRHGAISAAYYHNEIYRKVIVESTTGGGADSNKESLGVAGGANADRVAYYCPEKGLEPNHQILVVGWDDDFPAENFSITPPGNGAFLIKNSWGTYDDAGGYFWISYYDRTFARVKGDVASVYTRIDDTESAEGYDNVRSYDPMGLSGSMGMGSTTATAANMFVASTSETIRAVGTYLLQWNTKYTIQVYTGCTAGKPTSGVLAHTQSGTREFPGYETIDLATGIPIASGERYSVVVKLTTPGYTTPVPLQFDESSGLKHSRKKCSFLQGAKGAWTDLAAYDSKKPRSLSNGPKMFCCKAYTDNRVAFGFDGDAKQVFTGTLPDGAVLTVTVSEASGGVCQASAKVARNGKVVATYGARRVPVVDGVALLKSATGKDLWIALSGDERRGNLLTASLGGSRIEDFRSLNPNVTGYACGDFRVGVAATGFPEVLNETGRTITWTAKNLPAGVTIDPKTGCLSGAPTAVVKTVRTARVYATVSGGGCDSFPVPYLVEGLHGWAQGSKAGGGRGNAFTCTIGKTGKVSGKLFRGNTNWTFSATCLTSYEANDGAGCYRFSGVALHGGLRVPISFSIIPSILKNCSDTIPMSSIGLLEGTVGNETVFTAQSNIWGQSPYAAYAKVLAASSALKFSYGELQGLGESESLSLKFSKSGTVIAAGVFKGVYRGKRAWYKPSQSILLVPTSLQQDGVFRANVYPWFASNSTYRFQGFVEQIPLKWKQFYFRRDGE